MGRNKGRAIFVQAIKRPMPKLRLLALLPAGSFDKFLNVQITLIIVLQIVMCALHGSLALWWRNQHADNRYYLATTVQGQVRIAIWRSAPSCGRETLCRVLRRGD